MSSDIPPVDDEPTLAKPSRTRKIAWAVVAIAVVVGLGLIVHARIAAQRNPAVAGGPGGRGGPGGGPGGLILAVSVAKVTRGDVPVTLDSLGTVAPLATVTVHPQVTGPLVKIDFTEGQMVKKGQELAEIDPRPFQASVDQAKGQLQHDQALLANARVDLNRYKTLVEQNSVAEQTYATQQATVLQDEATLETDKAALETAQLNLSYTHIVSPVAGSVGLRQVDVGNVVTAYSSSVVVVTQLQPMSVLFTVPEDSLAQVTKRLRGGERLVVDAYDRTFSTKLDTGFLSNTDNEIDTATGTLKLRAMFNNADLGLFPNQFVNARLTLDTLHDQLLVPGAAVQQGATGNFVYVVDDSSANASGNPPIDPPPGGAAGGPPSGGRPGGFGAFGGATAGPPHVVHVRYVTTGQSVGNFVSVTQGLQDGETVVVDGAEQLRDGARVSIPQNNGASDQDAGAGVGTGPVAGGGRGGGALQRRGGRRTDGGPSGAAPNGAPSRTPPAGG